MKKFLPRSFGAFPRSSGARSRVSEVISLVICLLPVSALATTYYVAKTGRDAYSCAQAQLQSPPEQTIQAAVNCVRTPEDRSLAKQRTT